MSVALMEPLRPSKKTSAARVVMGGAAGSSRGDGLFNVPANINGLWAAASATSSRPSPSSSTVSRRKKRMQALAQQQVEADKYFIMSQDLAAKDSAVKLLTQEVSALRAALERTERSLKDEAATRAQEYQAASIRIQQLEEALIAAEGTEGQLRSHMAEQEKTLESLSDALHQSAKEPPQYVLTANSDFSAFRSFLTFH
jgi:septal ring factor EnvC (AmiA/AmiB activator)